MSKKSLIHRAAWLPAAVWMGIIFYLSSQSQVLPLPSPLLDLVVKKSSHMIGYGLLAWFYYLGLAVGSDIALEEALPWAWGMALFYAATDEFHQGFVPGRHSAPLDVIIDGVGALIGIILVKWISQRASASERSSYEKVL